MAGEKRKCMPQEGRAQILYTSKTKAKKQWCFQSFCSQVQEGLSLCEQLDKLCLQHPDADGISLLVLQQQLQKFCVGVGLQTQMTCTYSQQTTDLCYRWHDAIYSISSILLHFTYLSTIPQHTCKSLNSLIWTWGITSVIWCVTSTFRVHLCHWEAESRKQPTLNSFWGTRPTIFDVDMQ